MLDLSNLSLVTDTRTVIRAESRDGSVREFTLTHRCDKDHVSLEYHDQDYDYVSCIFFHSDDVTDEGCLGTWSNPAY